MTFEEAVRECRRLGVLQFKCPEFEFVIGPEPVSDNTPAVDNSSQKVKSQKKRGKDLLTAEQQLETYGVVLDAEE